jgi:hypothetical protein
MYIYISHKLLVSSKTHVIYRLFHVYYIIVSSGKLTLTKLKDAFAVMKNLVIEARSRQAGLHPNDRGATPSDREGVSNPSAHLSGSDDSSVKELRLEIEQLKSNLQQREHEIAILVNMVKQGVRVDGTSEKVPRMTDKDSQDKATANFIPSNSMSISKGDRGGADGNKGVKSLQQQQKDREVAREELVIKRHLFGVPPPNDKAIFDDAKGL